MNFYKKKPIHCNLAQCEQRFVRQYWFQDATFSQQLIVWQIFQEAVSQERIADTLQSRSAGGVLARDNEYPWVLLLTDSEWTRICTAVLVSRRHVLTAAHCVTSFSKDRNPEEYWCVSLFKIPITEVLVYPSFRCSNGTGDIALLELTLNMFTEASPISMPHLNELISMKVTSAGFGRNPDIPNTIRPMQVVNLTCRKTTKDKIITKTK
ncbi:trypsin [Dictyocaulus viviparus]|uniref:Trypsin n=1 Tax=Dictyocaulus viviparus TaxID=29172 RepID=A0A0D8YC20_DICVI|nr:trypsin [Dictyocaulus viviparus]